MLPNIKLKSYQQAALDRLQTYLQQAMDYGADTAFTKATGLPYRHAPQIEAGTPYICLRIPTGGGKTLLGATAIPIAADHYLQTAAPVVLWLVPSDAILEQTLKSLKNRQHPYRATLENAFGFNLTIVSRREALQLSRAEMMGNATILVATIQSFRRERENGKPNPDGLKVYEDNGALMEHFSSLTPQQKAGLQLVEDTQRPIASLANLLRLHRPMMIIDEAHNARTLLSFDTLARFKPALILELTATPQIEHAPARDKYASNILYSVSAAELKTEEMIKMPIQLTTNTDWQKTIEAACDCRASLEEAAKAEQLETGEYIRPIILFQAQSADKNNPDRLTYEAIEKHLIEGRAIAPEQIAVHTGNRSDLDLYPDISAPNCPIRYIITVQKLKEGWDCPFAYVLCSVAEQISKTAVEQILGRVLRLPKASRKRRDVLNRSYAFVASSSFDVTAGQLRDGLVEGAGFNRLEAERMVEQQSNFLSEIDDSEPHEIAIPPECDLSFAEISQTITKLPIAAKKRIEFEEQSQTLIWRGPMTKENQKTLSLAFARSASLSRAVDKLYLQSNHIKNTPALDPKPAFIVPRLGIYRQGRLELFLTDHFLNLPWRLDQCEASDIVNIFHPLEVIDTGQIDVDHKGRLEAVFVRRLQGELSDILQAQPWTQAELVGWIDRGIKHPDITKPCAVKFINDALQILLNKGFPLEDLAHNRYLLRRSITKLIEYLRREREQSHYKALFAVNAQDFATSSDIGLIFDEETYAYNEPYRGDTRFNKHYLPVIGDLKASGEEFDCALYLDRHDLVRYWIRNVENKPHAFWLQLPHGKFYPDFIALLQDGRILVVEYKGAHLYEGEGDKRLIGELWASASGGECLFCMPTDKEFYNIDDVIKG